MVYLSGTYGIRLTLTQIIHLLKEKILKELIEMRENYKSRYGQINAQLLSSCIDSIQNDEIILTSVGIIKDAIKNILIDYGIGFIKERDNFIIGDVVNFSSKNMSLREINSYLKEREETKQMITDTIETLRDLHIITAKVPSLAEIAIKKLQRSKVNIDK